MHQTLSTLKGHAPKGRTSALVAAMAAVALSACAPTTSEVDLHWSAQPHPDVSLTPRLGPQYPGIDAQLSRLDQVALNERERCLAAASDLGSWVRFVSTPFLGPRFLTIAVTVNADCGGAHPSVETTYFTFDRESDAPIDWAGLWPGRDVEIRAGDTGTAAGQSLSPELWAWYTAAVARDPTIDPGLRRLCADRVNPASGPAALAVWLEGAMGGLGMRLTDLPHAAEACGFVQVMPAAEMARLGASPVLIDAMNASKTQFDYSEMPR